ncbi:MAG: recombinase family protein [Thermodesulfovibrionia bacterium]|nr:recombinase family protein [Thermodesulfovibrionia bacterium]
MKVAGYIRVSSKEQIKGESLSTQRRAIEKYAKLQGWKYINTYADEGISGGSVDKRLALQQLLTDATEKRFDVVVAHRLSRFGRNARELLNNVDKLKKSGVRFISIKENIDFNTSYGEAMLIMLSAMAQLERDIIREQATENRIALAKKGKPTCGKEPFARTFKDGTWTLDTKKADLLRLAASEYLKGKSLRDISHVLKTRHNLPLGYHYLITVLKDRCGDEWSINFKDEEPITFKVPRILDDDTIQAIRDRLEHNRIECRKDVRKYVLTGFVRCNKCKKSLAGQTQINKTGREFYYYRHPGGKYETCNAFNSVPLKTIENAVFKTLFESIIDEAGFNEAIKESLPDTDFINSLKEKIFNNEKALKEINKNLDKLVDMVLEGKLRKETIHKKESDLYETKSQVEEELEQDKYKLKSLPNIEEVQIESKFLRLGLLDYFGSEERLQGMTFEEKKRLLHQIFDGKDEDGLPYGIYIDRIDKDKWDYFIYGNVLEGARTVKDEDIDYDMPSEFYLEKAGYTKIKNHETKGRRMYKTNSRACLNDHDLYPRPEQAGSRGKESGGLNSAIVLNCRSMEVLKDVKAN